MRSHRATGDAPSQTEPVRNGSFCPAERRRYVLIAAILASALGFIDGSVVSVAIPAIRTDLGASLADAQWISNAYALTLSALILAGGAMGDRFGLRLTFIAGISLFVAASMLCALSPDAPFLIGARAVQGIGAAIMVPSSLAIIAKAYPKQERGRAIGIWAGASALAMALGPVLGGFVLAAFDASVWRAIFAINLPLGLAAIYLLVTRVPSDSATAARRLDLAGAALATLAFGALAYGLTTMSESEGSGQEALFVGAGLILLVLFLLWEWRASEPMMDLALFRSAAFSGANAATFFLYFALSGVLFYLPMLLIAGWRLNEGLVGFIFMPLSVLIALLSGFVGRLSDSIGPRLPIAGGSFVVAISFAGLAAGIEAGVHGFWTLIFPMMTLMGLGMALVVSPLSTAIMTSVEDKDTGAASGINNAVARVAGLIAVASLGGVAALRYGAIVGEGAGIPGFGEPAEGLAVAEESLRLAASDAAFAAVAWVTAALSALSAVVAWMTIPGSAVASKAAGADEPA